MEILENLKQEKQVLELDVNYQGHYYRISNTLIILVSGLLCGQQKIDDIHEWSTAIPVQIFLEEYFGIYRIPSRAQFYKILGYVDAEKFNKSFIRWMNDVLKQTGKAKTISLDGKAICGTGKLY